METEYILQHNSVFGKVLFYIKIKKHNNYKWDQIYSIFRKEC